MNTFIRFYLWFTVVVGALAGLLWLSGSDNEGFAFVFACIALFGLMYALVGIGIKKIISK